MVETVKAPVMGTSGFLQRDERAPLARHYVEPPPRRGGATNGRPTLQRSQLTATSSASQISRIRSPDSRPKRSMSTPTETLSTESRFTADRRGTGSPGGSTTTSLGRPRIVVVHGAMRLLRSRGMAASRESTTTGRREMSGSSHHQISPLAGRLTKFQPLCGTWPSRPTHPAHREDVGRRLRRPCRSPQPGAVAAAQRAPRQ